MTIANCRSCGNNFENGPKTDLQKWLLDLNGIGDRNCSDCIARLFPPTWKASKPFINKGTGRTVGIEVECNPHPEWAKQVYDLGFVNATKDTSLRGYAFELTSPHPLCLDDAREWIEKVFGKSRARIYSRCGLHIWVGAPNHSWHEANAVLRYARVWEKAFTELVSPSRSGFYEDNSGRPSRIRWDASLYGTKQQFLRSLYGTNDFRVKNKRMSTMAASKKCNDFHAQGFERYPGSISRYWWFNMHGWWHRKAYEIRLHQGTTDAEKIWNWLSFWCSIIDKIADRRNIIFHPLYLTTPELREYYTSRRKFFVEKLDRIISPQATMRDYDVRTILGE